MFGTGSVLDKQGGWMPDQHIRVDRQARTGRASVRDVAQLTLGDEQRGLGERGRGGPPTYVDDVHQLDLRVDALRVGECPFDS